MKNSRITFDLPPPLAKWVAQYAKAQGVPVSQVMREALKKFRFLIVERGEFEA